jgi:ABC-type transport system involved in multi-copper enzyme maturation permease subunit
MLVRMLAIALNTYREAVRARLLLGIFALGLATCAYSFVIATLSLHNETRVVADLNAASMSLYGVIVAIAFGSTSLYRELEYKTIFPILSRPVARWEYLLGKYFGTMLTVAVWVAVDAAASLMALAVEAGQPPARIATALAVDGALLVALLLAARRGRVFVAAVFAPLAVVVSLYLASPAPDERRLLMASAVLAVCEVAVVAAVATMFSSFSSPVLTATFTAMVFVIGRSADTLARLPTKALGPAIATTAHVLARIFPNLHVYVPARTLLLGHVSTIAVWPYVAMAAAQAVAYSSILLVLGILAFRRRDFA